VPEVVTGLIGDLLPPPVVAMEAFEDPPDATLFPEESAVVARSVDKRRREFTTARVCARAALAQLGIPPVPVLPGPRGEPVWPAGIVGSMTHCAGYRAAAVARSTEVASIGLDAEPNQPLPEGVLEMVTVPEELTWLAALTAEQPRMSWDRLLFSAKEAVYKTWFPLTHRWLDFHEAVVTMDPARRSFTARLLVPGPVVDGVELTGFTGGWRMHDGLLVTAIVLRHP
jgi:4'-phosphopantetheinyl transferase EntD